MTALTHPTPTFDRSPAMSFLRRAAVAMTGVAALTLGAALPAQAGPPSGMTRCDVVWYTIDAAGETFFGKIYYCVSPTNRRYIWNVAGQIDPLDGLMRVTTYTPVEAWSHLYDNPFAYEYNELDPDLSTKNAFIQQRLDNDGVSREAVVSLP